MNMEEEKKNQEELGISCEVTVDAYTDFIFVNRFGGVQHQMYYCETASSVSLF